MPLQIIYSSNYKKENTKWLVIHHCGGIGFDVLASTKHHTAEMINQAHKARWNFIDPLTGKYGGYNFFITSSGEITQFRALGSETCAQLGFNFNGVAISICLAGNFTKGVDLPTREQENALRELYKQLPQVAPYNIVGHRSLTGFTECPGNALKDDWARNIILDRNTQLSIMLQMLSIMMDILRKMKNPVGKLQGWETTDKG